MNIIPPDHKWLSCKNIPNALSLARMLLVAPFLLVIRDIFVYECPKNGGLLLIFSAIILSDIADGFLARKLRCASNAGAKLDIISDSLYTLFSLSAFAYFKIIPIWFILVLLCKLGEFIITSKIVTAQQKTARAVVFDKAGKVSVSAAMLLPGIFVFRCIITDYKTVMNIIIYIITAMLAISFVSRVINTIRCVRRYPAAAPTVCRKR